MKDWKALLRPESLAQLQANYRQQLPLKGSRREVDFEPVSKLFNATGGGCWLITEVDEDGLAFGLADLGYPELGYISLPELAEFRGLADLGIEEDRFFKARLTLSGYADDARKRGYIHA
ncbi:DUF2958 domain-containing protein [Sphingomonas aerophila]|uniref:DUF2958 domain-containing protein n=1 Tax=Sphingomonas aerophila TaxID=1344948 RepID=A0A7W9EV57_9SPHN|nr:DUF2958 domain-containing protein [Sphingomonas aerophila]MBB5715865.1 hypothetical protein [Sphingomonas aerophila]